jgi:PadR family transcriptional regulator PadR
VLILRTLQWGPQHGYAIGQMIRAQSSDVLQPGLKLFKMV